MKIWNQRQSPEIEVATVFTIFSRRGATWLLDYLDGTEFYRDGDFTIAVLRWSLGEGGCTFGVSRKAPQDKDLPLAGQTVAFIRGVEAAELRWRPVQPRERAWLAPAPFMPLDTPLELSVSGQPPFPAWLRRVATGEHWEDLTFYAPANRGVKARTISARYDRRRPESSSWRWRLAD